MHNILNNNDGKVNNIDEEDEDVVIQGSALHEHLSQLGYTDFESVSVPKKTYFEEKKSLNIDIQSAIRKIYVKLFSFYSWITQEKSISEKQLSVILNAEALLDDHFSMINSFLTKCSNNSKKITLQDLIVTGAIIVSSTCISLFKHKLLPTLFASSAISCAGYTKYSRLRANRDLKNIISLQNELFAMCKKSLKILRRDYKIKLDSETCVPQFFNFLEERLQYLRPLMETLVEFMKNVSHVYYQCSLAIVKLLPPDILNEESYTKFESNSFETSGEIDYQSLKKLYHTYLLAQSEMLYLLAVAYESGTWTRSCRKIPEAKLACAIRILPEKLAVYKIELSKALRAYDKAEPMRYEVRDVNRAKWHDPTVQLDLASHKLQLAYNQVFSIFRDIDDCVAREIGVDGETAETLMRRLDKAFKEIGAAKSLAEFVVLLLAKSGFNDLRDGRPASGDGVTTTNNNQNTADLPVIIDSDPEILDEVFEEYIKEEYSRTMRDDEADECSSLERRKLDKLLIRSFMSELKEALVDKHKSMSERESKALRRTCGGNASKDATMSDAESSVSKDRQSAALAPPPMPPYDIWLTPWRDVITSNSNYKQTALSERKVSDNSSISREKIDESTSERSERLADATRYKNIFNIPSTTEGNDKNNDERDGGSLASLPQILLEAQATRFVAKLPPAFLQEETFVGSGENSEDEVAENASDDDENEDENFE